ncbi:hypothetical protein SAMN05443637_12048 [Pseudonocardia thermophila]|jgi:hypothetical protein|uniref:Lipoprotein LprG n=1 Tax=Pseudonocardia thermophila TaxID=1848 RepID=A0A1M6YJD4_PSETH|nr:hypothetical protein [Pseudonocardia thermophila]SHL18230.1 hypothetical protein SAMN05443637_12048 [Pseudonocardia thermophila]
MRKPFLLAAFAAVVVALAGCGGATAGTAAPAGAPPAPVAYTSIDELSAAMAKATADKHSATMQMDIGLGGQSMTGEGAYAIEGRNVKMRLTMSIPQAGEMEMRLVDNVLYVKAGPANPAWLRMPIDPNDPRTAEFAQIIDQVDVSKQFDQFKIGGELTGSSPDTIDGAATTRYDVKVDVAKALAEAPDAQTREQLRPLQEAGVQNVDMQLWIDSSDLPRQFRSSFTSQGQPVSATVKLSDWGAPVSVEAPPADQVTDLPG